MLTLLEMNEAINDTIKAALVGTDFESVPLQLEYESDTAVRPSIKVDIESLKTTQLNSHSREKTLTTRVYFFAMDIYKYKANFSKMQALLEDTLLDGLYVGDTYMPITSIASEVIDATLKLSFDLYVVELLPDIETSELMENLEYKEKLYD